MQRLHLLEDRLQLLRLRGAGGAARPTVSGGERRGEEERRAGESGRVEA